MKREFLEGLGLSSELIDQIMAEHGKTVTSLENKLTAKDGELQTSKTTIGELSEKVKKFDGVDLEGLKNGVKEWEKKYQTDLDALRLDNSIKLSIITQTHDADLVAGLVDKSKLKLNDNGQVDGLDDQLKTLKESKPFLFKEDKTASEGTAGSFTPFGGTAADTNKGFDFGFQTVIPKPEK